MPLVLVNLHSSARRGPSSRHSIHEQGLRGRQDYTHSALRNCGLFVTSFTFTIGQLRPLGTFLSDVLKRQPRTSLQEVRYLFTPPTSSIHGLNWYLDSL